jgi:hypothetical protein
VAVVNVIAIAVTLSGVFPYTHLSTKSLQDAADIADEIIGNALRRTE